MTRCSTLTDLCYISHYILIYIYTFRYNDPTEAANMRLNLSNSQHGQHLLGNHLLGNQSLLSQSLSDLRSSPMILNETQRNNLHLFNKSSTPVRKRSADCNNLNNNCDVTEDLLEETNFIANSPNNALDRLSRIASPDSMATMTPTSSQVSTLQKKDIYA